MSKKMNANGLLKGILGYSDKPLVSSDYIGAEESSIVDAFSTRVIGGKSRDLVKILSWYDNERATPIDWLTW